MLITDTKDLNNRSKMSASAAVPPRPSSGGGGGGVPYNPYYNLPSAPASLPPAGNLNYSNNMTNIYHGHPSKKVDYIMGTGSRQNGGVNAGYHANNKPIPYRPTPAARISNKVKSWTILFRSRNALTKIALEIQGSTLIQGLRFLLLSNI